jgi:PAS domain S-box-containing protein
MSQVLTPSEYRALVDHSPVMIWRAGTDTLCNYFNETWLSFTGRTLEQESGEGWAQGVHPEDLKPCVDYYLEHFHRQEGFEMEYRLRRHDGVYRYILDRGTPFFGDDGTFKGFIGSCVDVDDRRRAEAEREHYHQENLTSAQNFEKWILAIVSHDIRNPLGVIELSARTMLAKADDPSVVKRNADRASRGIDRIKHIVGDLLDLSRARHGGVPVSLATADAKEICKQVIKEFDEAAASRPIRFECEDVDGTVICDRHRVLQAISNLVGNAIQHSPPGSPVAVRVSAADERVSIAVHNQGHISEEILPLLFNPFIAGSRTRGRRDGLGLGLFIAQAIARAHDGEVQVESTPASGTTFLFAMPRRPERARAVA